MAGIVAICSGVFDRNRVAVNVKTHRPRLQVGYLVACYPRDHLRRRAVSDLQNNH